MKNVGLPFAPILTGLNEHALKLLRSHASAARVESGTIILREGDEGHEMYLIETGLVRIFKQCDGDAEKIELAQLGPGEFFGESCILDPSPRAASAEAIHPTVLHRLSSGAFYRLYKAHPDQYSILVLNIARDLSRRLKRLDKVFAACH